MTSSSIRQPLGTAPAATVFQQQLFGFGAAIGEGDLELLRHH